MCSAKRRSSSAARGPLVSQPGAERFRDRLDLLLVDRGRLEREKRLAHGASRGLGDDLGTGRYELYELGSAVGPGEGVLARVAGREDEAGAVGAPAERPERPPGPAVGPDVGDAVLRPRVLEPADV